MRAHLRQDELGESCQTEEVHLKLVACLVKSNVLDRTVGTVPCVIDEDVNAPLLGDNGLYSLLDGVFVSDVQLKRNHAEGAKLFELFQTARCTINCVSCGCEILRGIVADA